MSVSGKCFNVEYSIWKQWMKSHPVEMTLQIPIPIIIIIIWRYWTKRDFRKNCPPMERDGEGSPYSSMCCNMFRLHGDENGQAFPRAQYINIMYALDSTRKKFDVWISGVVFLSDNATRPVQWAAEMRQSIQTSNLYRRHFSRLASSF